MYTEKVLIYPMKTSGFDEISLCNDMDWIAHLNSIIELFGCDRWSVLQALFVVVLVWYTSDMT